MWYRSVRGMVRVTRCTGAFEAGAARTTASGPGPDDEEPGPLAVVLTRPSA